MPSRPLVFLGDRNSRKAGQPMTNGGKVQVEGRLCFASVDAALPPLWT